MLLTGLYPEMCVCVGGGAEGADEGWVWLGRGLCPSQKIFGMFFDMVHFVMHFGASFRPTIISTMMFMTPAEV